jgi:hypothetical protein
MPNIGGPIWNIGGGSGGLFGFGGEFSKGTVSLAGSAVSDFFAADASRLRAQGARIEGEEYGQAAQLAALNARYAKESTDIKDYQIQRKANQAQGDLAGDIASNNFEQSGSAIDVMRDSATQGALKVAVAQQQGLIEVAGYQEQERSYLLMQDAANVAAKADEHAATGQTWAGAISGAAAVASIL